MHAWIEENRRRFLLVVGACIALIAVLLFLELTSDVREGDLDRVDAVSRAGWRLAGDRVCSGTVAVRA